MKAEGGMSVRILCLEAIEFAGACDLVRDSFLRCVAPLYSPEGVENFLIFSCSESVKERVLGGSELIGAFRRGRLVGVMELGPERHIAMLFVGSHFQGMGVGKALLLWGLERMAREDHEKDPVTVNSSPNARGFYEAAGFTALEPERTVEGIRFIPMAYVPDGRPSS